MTITKMLETNEGSKQHRYHFHEVQTSPITIVEQDLRKPVEKSFWEWGSGSTGGSAVWSPTYVPPIFKMDQISPSIQCGSTWPILILYPYWPKTHASQLEKTRITRKRCGLARPNAIGLSHKSPIGRERERDPLCFVQSEYFWNEAHNFYGQDPFQKKNPTVRIVVASGGLTYDGRTHL